LIKPVFHITILILLLVFSSKAQQNLVPNPSFEDTVYCPNGTNDPGAVSLWYNPTAASPDYYNVCSSNGGGVPLNDWGYQYAQDGNAYIGVSPYFSTISNYREYLQIQLIHKLEANKVYCWSFWISLLDSIDFASNNIGIGLSQNPITDFSTQSILPINCIGFENEVYTDRNNWKQVSGTFIANGQEEYLTLGNFFNDANTTFTQVGSNSSGGAGAYYFIDNVFLGDCITEITFPNIFSPNNDGINDYFSIKSIGVIELNITIVNRWGEKVYVGESDPTWDGKYNDAECSEGVYFYVCNFKNVQLDRYETKTGFIELMR
jgi:gliding motility-associated-like protein